MAELPSLDICKRYVDMALRDRVSSRLGGVMWMVGLNDLKGIFQLKRFYEITINK